MAANNYDVIVIGGGHNGLVAAAYLAKAGKKVIVLERRSFVGGSAVTEDFGGGLRADAVWTGGMLRPDVVEELDLRVPAIGEKPAFNSVLGAGRSAGPTGLTLYANPARAAECIRPFSEKDARKWPEFASFMKKSARMLYAMYATSMPRLPRGFTAREGFGLAEMAVRLRLMGRKDMLNLIRLLPMTAVEFLEEWFESEELKGALGSLAVYGVTLGVMSAGTGFTLLHNWLNRGGLANVNAGRAGEMTTALAEAVRRYGGEIRTDAEVERIQVDTYTCRGVILSSGEEIQAASVISAVDPKRTFLDLVGAVNLPPEFVWKVQSIKMRGSVAMVHLLTNGQHGLPAGTSVVAPSLKYLERAYDAAKYGEISEQPYIEATTYGNVISIHFQYAPYALKNNDWKTESGVVQSRAIETLAAHFPDLKASIVGTRTITPRDLEATYGLTEGDPNHGQLMLDQFLFMRPIPGWSNHKTPVDGLYLCGSGVHGGGGISGAPGRNVAKIFAR
ncbi:MAG: phytoene desaturase family protein [Anaerolineae bacterium]